MGIAGVAWRKSSRSEGNGGDCIEVAVVESMRGVVVNGSDRFSSVGPGADSWARRRCYHPTSAVTRDGVPLRQLDETVLSAAAAG
jgi:hypothetical protein